MYVLPAAALHAASRPRRLLAAGWGCGAGGVGVTAAGPPRGARTALNGGTPSETECDAYLMSNAGIDCGCGVLLPRFKDMERRCNDRVEAVGEVLAAAACECEDIDPSSSSSSAIPKSASPISALRRLFDCGISVCVDCSESAHETGREDRDGAPATGGRMV